MRHYPYIVYVIIISLFVLVCCKRDNYYNCIEFSIPITDYLPEYRESVDTFPKIQTFKLDTIVFTVNSSNKDFEYARKKLDNLLSKKEYRTGIVIDFSKANYNGFIKSLDLFVKREIRVASLDFKNDKIYYFPSNPPCEFAFNRLFINYNNRFVVKE